ncbi:MAG: TonB family protein [Ignavibacteriaceae bacterium]|jgi:protein TonB|nr:TonB family protein [Ignavibacteriaceae bacterium]
MNDKALNMTDITDIIFANKNKDYGAYVLRKSYNRYVTWSVIIGSLFFVLSISGPVIYKSMKAKDVVQKKRVITLDISQLSEPPSIDKATPPPTVEAPPLKTTIQFLPPVVRPDEQVKDEVVPTVDELKKVDPGAKTQVGQEGGVDYSLVETQEKIVDEPKKEEAQIFTYVEEMPTFPGGDEAFYTYVGSHIVYPEIAKRAGVEGKLWIQFVVSTSGKVSDVVVQKGIGAGCDEEAVRVVKSMPNWTPGRQNGHPVNVRMSVPIVFKLQ